MHKRERTCFCPVPGCDYLSYSVHGIQAHVRYKHPAHAPTDSTDYICPICEADRRGLAAMMTHLDQAHRFEDFDNPVADARLHEGVLRFLDYAEKLAEFNRRYPEAA